MIETVNERTTAYLAVSFLDKAGVAAAPSSVTYSVYCKTNGVELRAATALTPGSTVEIALNAADNAIVTPSHQRELRCVTVRAVYGASDELNDEYEYYVKNLARAP